MAEDQIIDVLEKKVYQALRTLAEQQKRINSLLKEKQELEKILKQKELYIQNLQHKVEQLNDTSNDAVVQAYREKEEKLRKRIQDMLQKIDELKLLE